MNLTKEQALQQIENLKKFVDGLDKPKLPELIEGHWYQNKNLQIWIYCRASNALININTGYSWKCNPERKLTREDFDWKDVTDDYKIVKI